MEKLKSAADVARTTISGIIRTRADSKCEECGMIQLALIALQVAAPAPAVDPNHNLTLNFAFDDAFVLRYDADLSRALTPDEFKAGVRTKLREAVNANPAAKAKITPENIERAVKSISDKVFILYDVNHDGALSVAELKPSLRKNVA